MPVMTAAVQSQLGEFMPELWGIHAFLAMEKTPESHMLQCNRWKQIQGCLLTKWFEGDFRW